MQITTIGLDIAKHVFQVHGIDAEEKVIVRKQLRRGQVIKFFEELSPCLVGLEACATSHYWARELSKLGHEVRLMPAKDVKAYLNRNKYDAADAEAICEAVRRPTMRFVQVKSAEQQAHLMQHRVRDLLMQQRTQLINSMRLHLAELGSGWLFGAICFEVTGGPDARQLLLEFPRKSANGELLDPLPQVICCHWRKAHFGGRHLMFTCPQCNREARVLYARYANDRIWFFSCRKCAGITYRSTMGHRWDRSARHVEKLRARLKWGAHGTAPIKPRGMHERTYQRILGLLAYHEAIRSQGSSYARKYRPDQHRAHLWWQCRADRAARPTVEVAHEALQLPAIASAGRQIDPQFCAASGSEGIAARARDTGANSGGDAALPARVVSELRLGRTAADRGKPVPFSHPLTG